MMIFPRIDITIVNKDVIMSLNNAYLEELDRHLNDQIKHLEHQNSKQLNRSEPIPLIQLLTIALKNEWETSLLTAEWISNEEDIDFALSLAQLAGDEAKHFRLIQRYIEKQGFSVSFSQMQLKSPLYHCLKQFQQSFERVVAGPYTREALAVMRNKVFLDYCKENNHNEVLDFYQIIQHDERHHHLLGKKLLAKKLNSNNIEKAKHVTTTVLKVVDDIQEMMILKKGLNHLPGC